MNYYTQREATKEARRRLLERSRSKLSYPHARFFKERVIPAECRCGECMAVLSIYQYKGRGYSELVPFCRRCGAAEDPAPPPAPVLKPVPVPVRRDVYQDLEEKLNRIR